VSLEGFLNDLIEMNINQKDTKALRKKPSNEGDKKCGY
jgi:hypothetical protein